MVSRWTKNLKKGEEGENVVYDVLKEDGYRVIRLNVKEEGERITRARKIAKRLEAENLTIPDSIITKFDEENDIAYETFFCDPKFKSKREYLGMVNVSNYHGYWALAKRLEGIPVKVFFYIKETNEIWTHTIRDPDEEPHFPKEFKGNTYVYKVFMFELERYKILA